MGTRTMIHDLISIGFAAIALVGGTLLSGAASAAEVQSAPPTPDVQRAPTADVQRAQPASDVPRAQPTPDVQRSQPTLIAPDSGCPQLPLVEPIYLLRIDTLL
jgi:hypothetical protein